MDEAGLSGSIPNKRQERKKRRRASGGQKTSRGSPLHPSRPLPGRLEEGGELKAAHKASCATPQMPRTQKQHGHPRLYATFALVTEATAQLVGRGAKDGCDTWRLQSALPRPPLCSADNLLVAVRPGHPLTLGCCPA
ncbi:Hypothetical predicted protein [Cloeon dipterum]|uniref:Uncharacterized protein n=1 Tax=Cloeon dipterum TaxID=197152 RepID=A0A8S1BS26_9INSE|nr:Hypothetical predicted protein [Cloeon dipterum]